jgi:FdhD protein
MEDVRAGAAGRRIALHRELDAPSEASVQLAGHALDVEPGADHIEVGAGRERKHACPRRGIDALADDRFAVGFSLTEGVVSSLATIASIEIVEEEVGIELRIWLKERDAAEFLGRRRKMAGPTGCGLCGIESLIEAMRPPPEVRWGLVFTPDQIMTAIDTLFPLQELNRETRAVHGAGFFDARRGLVAVREDVGRHNALDKLAGALARERTTAEQGMVLLTSRVSVEMVQKSAAIGAPIIVAVSAPTALAVRMAEAAGMTLVAVAREDGFEVFTHPYRIKGATAEAVRVAATRAP